jgi:hypothetical protein
MLVYLITEEQSKELMAVNDETAQYIACGNKAIEGLYISDETLSDPKFYKQKAVFDTFPQPIPTADIDIYAI